MAFEINVNGAVRRVDVAADTPLLWVLRDELDLVGTKFGCGQALCGACTVWLDGQPVRACATPVDSVGDGKIVTIEGISGKAAEAVRKAWADLDVPQCGYCQSGQIMAATALLESNAKPTEADIEAALDGNVCRCATYHRIHAAVHQAAKSMEG
jgi:isoquinoline 1-oxidoreductase alpha subunit